MPAQQTPQHDPHDNILRQRALQKQKSLKKVRLLLIIGVLVLTLTGIVLYAANRQGGVTNLFKGDQDPISNSIKNIGSSISGTDQKSEEEKLLQQYRTQPFKLFDTPIPSDSDSSEPEGQRYINLVPNQSNYEISVKVGEIVIIDNFSGGTVSLQFSDNRNITLRDSDEKTTKFSSVGKFTFEDSLDSSPYKITGVVTVTP